MKMRSILDRVRMIPRAVESLLVEPSRERVEKRITCGSLSRVTVGEGLVPHVESCFFWFTDVEITQNNSHGVGV